MVTIRQMVKEKGKVKQIRNQNRIEKETQLVIKIKQGQYEKRL